MKRFSRAHKKDIQVPQPKLIAEYNGNMGGVDKMDWNVQKYRIRVRGKKWYFHLVTNAVDVALVNAHAIYCLSNAHAIYCIPLLDYRRTVARAYPATSSPYSDPKKAGRLSLAGASSSRIPLDVRAAGNHYIGKTEGGKQRKCAVCKKKCEKTMQCLQCRPLCGMLSKMAYQIVSMCRDPHLGIKKKC